MWYSQYLHEWPLSPLLINLEQEAHQKNESALRIQIKDDTYKVAVVKIHPMAFFGFKSVEYIFPFLK